MDEVVAALTAQQDELAVLVGGLDPGGLAVSSRCDGWSVADVLLHLAQTNEMAIASVQGRLVEVVTEMAAGISMGTSVDDWAGAVVAKERGAPLTEVRDRWATSAAAQVAAFATVDPAARVVWVAGDMAARTLATTRLTETWIHTGDIAVGLGVDLAPTERLRHTARLVWRTLPYAFSRAGRTLSGPVTFELTAPDGTTWRFADDGDGARVPATVVTGTALDLCTVAGQRGTAAGTSLRADGPDADGVLLLARTFA